MLVHNARRSSALRLAGGLVLSLSAVLAACTGAPGERPALPATATAPTPTSTATSTATATPAAPTPTADATAAGTPSPTTFRYNRLDTTGAAATAGSYAFLTTAGDAASAIDNFGAVPDSVELRIHPADAGGTSRATFYDAVKAGESFDYRTNGLECGLRFKVTSVATTTTPTFGLEWVFLYGGYCGWLDGMPGAARDVEFVWGVGPGIPDPDGVNALLRNEPAGAGTYRLYEGLPYVIDVPAGKRVILSGYLLVSYRARDPGISPGNPPNTAIRLIDADTGSVLFIDRGHGRGDQSRYHLTRWRGLVRSDHGVDPARGVGGPTRRAGCEQPPRAAACLPRAG